MPTDNDIVRAWCQSGGLIRIRKASPFDALNSLHHHNTASHLDFTRAKGFVSKYLPDNLALHRQKLRRAAKMAGIAYVPDDYITYHGNAYPDDLSTVLGYWKVPMDITFRNLVVLNLDLLTAIYWAIPIISVTSTVFRRLIIQRVDAFKHLPFAFPYTELDHCLVAYPDVKVIMVYSDDECLLNFTDNLPLLDLAGNLAFIEEPAIESDLGSDELAAMPDQPRSYTFDPADDPHGEDSIFEALGELGNSEGYPIVVDVD